MVHFKPNENDKRIKQLYLTEQGNMLDERMNENQINKMKQYFSESGDKEGSFGLRSWNYMPMKLVKNMSIVYKVLIRLLSITSES